MKKIRTRPGQKVGLKTERILEVALHLIAEKGYDESSFQMIASRLKVSQSAIMYRFKSKALLLEALAGMVVKSNHEYVSRLMQPKDSAILRLRKHFEGNLDWAVSHPDGARFVLLIYYQASHDRAFKVLYSAILRQARVRILEYIHAAQREGHSVSMGSPEKLAAALHDNLLGAVVNHVCASSKAVDSSGARELKARWRDLLSLHLPA